jgi:DNA-binding HxlR family transcriptional regulator
MRYNKNSLWVFADIKSFFDDGLGTELVNYEISLPKKFNLPMLAICAYDAKNIDAMSTTDLNNLYKHHNSKWLYLSSNNDSPNSLFYVISRLYALEILRALSQKPLRFSELKFYAPNESTRVTRLKELEDANLIITESKKVRTRHFVYYSITKKGMTTLAKINSLK